MTAILKCVFAFVLLFGSISLAEAQVGGSIGASGSANTDPGGANVGAGVNANANARTSGTSTEAGAKLNTNVKPPTK